MTVQTESPPTPDAPTTSTPEPAAAPVVPADTPAASAPPADPGPSFADIMGRSDVRAEIAKTAKLAAKQAQDEAEASAKQAAERAKLDEVERLKLEKTESDARAKAAEDRSTAAERERDLANHLITTDVKLANPRALDFLKFQAFGIVDADPQIAMGDAVKQVLADHAYLVAAAPTTGADGAAVPESPPAPVQRPSTAPTVKTTQTPAAAKTTPGVDVLSMTKQEYEAYKRKSHPGIN